MRSLFHSIFRHYDDSIHLTQLEAEWEQELKTCSNMIVELIVLGKICGVGKVLAPAIISHKFLQRIDEGAHRDPSEAYYGEYWY